MRVAELCGTGGYLGKALRRIRGGYMELWRHIIYHDGRVVALRRGLDISVIQPNQEGTVLYAQPFLESGQGLD